MEKNDTKWNVKSDRKNTLEMRVKKGTCGCSKCNDEGNKSINMVIIGYSS